MPAVLTPRPRTLILLAKKRVPDLTTRIDKGEEPRVEYLELAQRLGAELLDFHSVEASPLPAVRWITRRLGLCWGLALLGVLRRREFDHVYATGEDVGIPLTILLRALRCHEKLTMVVHNAGTPKRTKVLRALGHRAYRHVICLGSEQQQVLTQHIGLPPSKVRRFNQWCDHRFYQPARPLTGDYVLSVGMESRDYPTLQTAARGLPYKFHVIASGWSPGAGFGAAGGIDNQENITVERGVSYSRLRELYANCRFVVVPLKSVSYAAGVTGIVESMAMGKAVIASASPGILDYVKDGVSGRLVKVGDPASLREAIVDLWEHPERTIKMGAHNRKWVETSINTDRYVADIAELFGLQS